MAIRWISASLCVVFITLPGVSLAQPQVTLSASLGQGPDAETSSGLGTAICRHAATAKGHWSVREASDGVCWLTAGNFDKQRGTLGFRFRPAWKPGDTSDRVLIGDDKEFGNKAENAFRIWKWEGKVVRFDLRSAEDRYLTVPLNRFPPGQWRHLAVAWDADRGTRLYVDGQRVATADYKFTVNPGNNLTLGSFDRFAPGLGDYRDLVVLDQMLDDEKVAKLAEGTLKLPAAPKLAAANKPPVQSKANRPRQVFRANFEDTLVANLAAGDKNPRRAEGVRFVDSPFGRAAYFGEKSVLEYAGGENLPHDRGAISLWVRPDWAPGTARTDHVFLREAPPDQPGDDCRWIWYHKAASSLRFDLRTPGDPYVQDSADGWRPGAWHHLVLAWDAASGLAEQYVDGRRVDGGGDSRKVFLHPSWTPKSKPHFWVGSRNGQSAALVAIDELVIFDAPLSSEDVSREYSRHAPLTVDTPTPYLEAGKALKLPVVLTNRSAEKVRRVSVTLTRLDNPGSQLSFPLSEVELLPGQSTKAELPLAGLTAGDYTLEAAPAGKLPGPPTSFRLCAPPQPRAERPTEKLVTAIDLTSPLSADRYCDTGDCRVVDSPLGRYREASDKKGSRFAVRLRLEKLGVWHRLEWTWPDDKPRTSDVILNGGSYDVATGTLAGDEYPNTGKMRTQSAYFWPRSQDDAVVFMTAERGRPAAAASVKVFELSGPPAAIAGPSPRLQGVAPRRVGLYYEDPVLAMNFGGQSSFPAFADVVDRLVAYMEACGFNTLYYPAVWYHGPLYPSPSQGDGQRRSRPHPRDFLSYLLRAFESRGLQLVVTFNVHDLRSLANVETDEDRVRAGASTPLTVRWNSTLKLSGWHGTEGCFNPLDPRVHTAVRGLVAELAERYGRHPAFGGICFHIPRHSLLWFGSLDCGYNDENLRGFERELGLSLGVDYADPLHANRAYRVLMDRHRQQWIDWRCQRIARQWEEHAAILRGTRPDLKLVVNLYSLINDASDCGERISEAFSFTDIAREAGVDVDALAKIPNVRVVNTLSPGLYRWNRSRRAPYRPEMRAIRVADFLPSAFEPFAVKCREFGVQLHDKYWEDDIAARSPLQPMKAWGQRELGWRVSTLVPPSPHGLENYAEALGAADIHSMTKGGFVVGSVGLEDQLTPWAAAFRQLPAVPFDDLPGLADPVRVRVCRRSDGEWAYAQNRLYDTIELVVRVEGEGPLTNLATGESIPVTNGRAVLRLGGYQLVSLWSPSGRARVTGGEVRGAEATGQRLAQQVQRLQTALANAPAELVSLAKPRLALVEQLLREGRLARASHVLEEPWAAKLTDG